MISSAFGIAGLNVIEFTDMYNLGVVSFKFILLMFIGQLGVFSILLISIKGIDNKKYIGYVDIQIG